MTSARSVSVLAALAFACSSSSESGAPASSSVAPGPGPSEPRDGDTKTPAADAGLDASVRDAAAEGGQTALALGTGGKGGLTCVRQDVLGGGRQSCVAKVGTVELKLVEGRANAANSGAPLRLGVYLHGDGAEHHHSNDVLEAMLPWADAHHGLAVSALAPNGCAWWLSPAHDCSGSQNDYDGAAESSAALATALDAVMKAFDIRTDGMRYYGASGGSMFLTEQWIPLQGGRYPGVFAIMCGAATSSRKFAWNTNDGALRARSPLSFTYGDGDGLLPDIKETIAAFLSKGFAVTEKVIPNQGHCTFDVHGEAMAIWSANP